MSENKFHVKYDEATFIDLINLIKRSAPFSKSTIEIKPDRFIYRILDHLHVIAMKIEIHKDDLIEYETNIDGIFDAQLPEVAEDTLHLFEFVDAKSESKIFNIDDLSNANYKFSFEFEEEPRKLKAYAYELIANTDPITIAVKDRILYFIDSCLHTFNQFRLIYKRPCELENFKVSLSKERVLQCFLDLGKVTMKIHENGLVCFDYHYLKNSKIQLFVGRLEESEFDPFVNLLDPWVPFEERYRADMPSVRKSFANCDEMKERARHSKKLYGIDEKIINQMECNSTKCDFTGEFKDFLLLEVDNARKEKVDIGIQCPKCKWWWKMTYHNLEDEP